MSGKKAFPKVPDSVWEDFEELQAELGGTRRPVAEKPSGSVAFDDSSWEFVLGEDFRDSVETALNSTNQASTEIPSTKEIPKSHFDEFFAPADSEEVCAENQNDVSKYLFEISANSAKKKVFEQLASGAGVSFSSDYEKKLSLNNSEYEALCGLLGLPLIPEKKYSENQLIMAAKSMILMKLNILGSRNYSTEEMFAFARKADAIFAPYLEDIFEGFESQNIKHVFNINDKPVYSADTVLSFSLMKPSDRMIWVVSKYSVLSNVRLQLISFLGLNDAQKYSIEDIKTIADFYDTNGRKGSGILRTAGHLGFEASLVYKKKYSVDEVIRFVLLPQKGRVLWLSLQK